LSENVCGMSSTRASEAGSSHSPRLWLWVMMVMGKRVEPGVDVQRRSVFTARDGMQGKDAYYSTLLRGNRRVRLHKVQIAELLLVSWDGISVRS